jgi:uncharacterized protein YjdB
MRSVNRLLGMTTVAMAVAVLGGCGESGTSADVQPLQVRMDKQAITVERGGTETLVVKNGSGPLPPGARTTWESSDPLIARVNDGGTVLGVEEGDAVITGTVTFQGITQKARSNVKVTQSASRLAVLSGSEQTAQVGTKLIDPIRVRATEPSGKPLVGVTLVFAARDATGSTPYFAGSEVTDSDGTAAIEWTLSPVSGLQTLSVAIQGPSSPTVDATATALPADFDRLQAAGGGAQTAPVGTVLPEPLRVRALDKFGNPIAGAALAWMPDEGSGEAQNGQTATDASGYATASWRLGSKIGEQGMTAVSTAGAVRFVAHGSASATRVATSVSVTPSSATLEVGKTLQAVATVLDADSQPMDGATVVWASSSAAVAEVTSAGTVKAVSAGTATVTATSGTVSGSLIITVPAPATVIASVVASPEQDTLRAVGQTRKFSAIARDAQGKVVEGAKFEWKSLHNSIATVDGDGTVTAQSVGTALVVAAAAGCSGCAADTVNVSVMVAGGVYAVPASIDATGSKDVTPELMAFISSVPDGSTIVFPSTGTYRIEGTLLLHKRSNLVVEGNGVRFIANEAEPEAYAKKQTYPWRNRYHWSIEGSKGIVLRNMTIRGANANGGRGDDAYVVSLEAQHGVNIMGAEDVLIENISISYVYGDFVYVGALSRVISRNITVRGGIWSHNGRQGIAITEADGVLVEGISMTETRRASIDVEPNTASGVMRNITIRNSYFGPGRLLWFAAGGQAGTMENILVEGNRLDRAATVYIRSPVDENGNPVRRRSNFRFVGNVSSVEAGGGHRGIWNVWHVDGFEAKNNVTPVQSWRNQPGLWLYDVTRVDAPGVQWPGAVPQVWIEPIS